jgi:hypothetical protein
LHSRIDDDVLADQPLDQRLDLADDRIDLKDPRLEHLLAGEGKKLADQL